MRPSIIRHALRTTTAAIALVTFAACGDNSATGPDAAPSLARGSGGGGTPTTPSTPSTPSAAGKVEIRLSAPAGAPFASAKGKAKYANKGGERELQIEAENIPTGTAVVFTLNGVQIGTGVASALREVRLELNSTRGGTVPSAVAGQAVTVRTAAGAVIVSGSF